ncbi:hypothetical protein ACFSL6_25940 [Paenibacillus thailandensis]|uniref:hypothetical protein n=1 Tax=Paenibacillus thailandensis TaxID=393250 RepID=UPI00363AE021
MHRDAARQTIFYKKESEFDRTAQIFNKHKDVHLYVRDTLSFKLASEKFNRCCVYLSPDMAHQLWPIRHAGTRRQEAGCASFARDIEKTKEAGEAGGGRPRRLFGLGIAVQPVRAEVDSRSRARFRSARTSG